MTNIQEFLHAKPASIAMIGPRCSDLIDSGPRSKQGPLEAHRSKVEADIPCDSSKKEIARTFTTLHVLLASCVFTFALSNHTGCFAIQGKNHTYEIRRPKSTTPVPCILLTTRLYEHAL